MKPLNADTPGCNPISSNCVIWQGPDIPCISLCKGDTVSDVVYKLATELCQVLETLNITNYDLTCFNLGSNTPQSFQALIQFLVTRLCTVSGEGIPPVQPGQNQGEVIVNIAPCFYYTNELGDQVTTMTLENYVIAIGNRICTLVSTITQIQATLINHETRITNLENTPPPSVDIPQVTPSCVLPAVQTDVQVVVQALEQQFCQLLGATGSPSDIYTAIVKQCAGLSTQASLSNPGINMGSIPGWNVIVNNMAAALGNMWLTICDLRAAVQSIQLNCCPTGCAGISLDLQGVIDGSNLTLYLTGTIPAGFTTCSVLGTLVTITDTTGGSFTFYLDIVGYLNNPTGYVVNLAGTPVNLNSNLTVHMEPCLTNVTTGATCQSVINEVIVNQVNCPEITYNVTSGSVTYNGTSLPGTATYTVEVWNNAGTVMLGSQVQTLNGPVVLTGTFIGLAAGTAYKLRVKVDVSDVITTCPFTAVTTLPPVCPPPSAVSGNITID